jgi:hypothetical protein
MAWIVKQKRSSDSETHANKEIWKTILYLDPDRDLRRSDILFGVTWVFFFLLLCVMIFLFNH